MRNPSSSKSEGRPALDDSRPPAVARSPPRRSARRTYALERPSHSASGCWAPARDRRKPASSGGRQHAGVQQPRRARPSHGRRGSVRRRSRTGGLARRRELRRSAVRAERLLRPLASVSRSTPRLDTVACEPDRLVSATAAGNGEDRIAVTSSLPATVLRRQADDVIVRGSGDDLVSGAAATTSSRRRAATISCARPHDSPERTRSSAAPGSPPGNKCSTGPGNDLSWRCGRDTLTVERVTTYAFGRSGADEIEGDDGEDALVGLDGADTLDGGSGSGRPFRRLGPGPCSAATGTTTSLCRSC